MEQADGDGAGQQADGAPKHDEPPIVFCRQAIDDLIHFELPMSSKWPDIRLSSVTHRRVAAPMVNKSSKFAGTGYFLQFPVVIPVPIHHRFRSTGWNIICERLLLGGAYGPR